MVRVVLINILLFLLPLLLYVLYVWLARRELPPGAVLDDAPILWLLIAGTVLVIAALIFFISFEGAPPGGVYHPPSFNNGRIEPGRIE
ncbi:MAG: DUF6111 family protein [Hyphomicrobiaceae bacterium]